MAWFKIVCHAVFKWFPQCCSSSFLRWQQIHTISFQIYHSLTSSRPTYIVWALRKGLVKKPTRFISWGLTKCLGLIWSERETTSCHAHNTNSAYCCFAGGNCCLVNHTFFHDQLVAVSATDGVSRGLLKRLAVCIPLFKLMKDWVIDLYEMEGLVWRLYECFMSSNVNCV